MEMGLALNRLKEQGVDISVIQTVRIEKIPASMFFDLKIIKNAFHQIKRIELVNIKNKMMKRYMNEPSIAFSQVLIEAKTVKVV